MTTSLSGRRSQARAAGAAVNATIDQAVAQLKRERDEQWVAAKAAHNEQEATRHRFTREEVAGARAVRDAFGWHRVVRISAKSVTVETPYSWTDRIPLDKILEVAA